MAMDNQQATSIQLAWLAGIWDGEGTIHVYRNNKGFYIGRCTVANTSEIMINEISKILDSEDIGCHIYLEERRKGKHKSCYHMTVNKLVSVQKLIKLLLPYLVSKKAQAEILLRFIESRLNYKKQPIKDDKTGRIVGMKTIGYSEEEISCYEQLKMLNSTGTEGASSTTR